MIRGFTALLVLILLNGVTVCGAEEKQPPARFTYHGPKGLVFEVTADGLSSIRVGERPLAKGGWSVFNAEPWFKDSGSGRVSTKEIRSKSLEAVNDHLVRVRHVRGDVTCTTDYTFDGEDVLVSAFVENRHADEPMNVVGFSGLEFSFTRPPEGLMMVQHISYFQAHGLRLCHPGDWAKIGGSYAKDDSIGVGLSPWKTGWNRTLLIWDYTDWNPDKRESLPQRRPIYFVGAAVPARGARTFDMKMRVSATLDWKHLLEPYREHFQATFGNVRYKADFRWIASDYMNHSQQIVSPANPYGFHPGKRLDSAAVVKTYCDSVLPVIVRNGGQGLILWGQGGDDPRGGMYRPDFDVLPPEVEAQWPLLFERMKAAKLKLGVCTRPSDMALRLDWKSDQIININADDPGHREMLTRRFQNMTKRGCSLFYLDSFGSDLEHVKLMRHLRETLGPDVLTFCEHQCDAMLPFSGGYSETTLHKAHGGVPAHYRLWSGEENWQIYEWLVPGAQMTSRLYQIEEGAPKAFDPVEKFFASNRVTLLLPVSDFGRISGWKTGK